MSGRQLRDRVLQQVRENCGGDAASIGRSLFPVELDQTKVQTALDELEEDGLIKWSPLNKAQRNTRRRFYEAW